MYISYIALPDPLIWERRNREDIHGGDSQATASVSDGVLLLAPLSYYREKKGKNVIRKGSAIKRIQNKLQGKKGPATQRWSSKAINNR